MSNQDISRFVIKDENGEAVAMGQVRIKHVKPIGLRIGYIQRGPLVRGRNGRLRCSAEALNAVCEAYLGEKVNILRIVPNFPILFYLRSVIICHFQQLPRNLQL